MRQRYESIMQEGREALPIPARNLALIVLSIFIIEISVMLILHIVDLPLYIELPLNVLFLVGLSSPLVYLLLYRPLAAQVEKSERARTALTESEERYRLAEQAGNIGSWDWNILTGELHWSDTIEPMFGFAPGKFGMTYQAFLDSVHPEDRQFVIDSVNAAVEENREYAIEHRIVWPGRSIRWVSETGAVYRDENGKAVRMVGIVQDITERKKAENDLRYSEERYRIIMDALSDNGIGLFVVGKDYKVQFMNKMLVDAFGDQTGNICYKSVGKRDTPCEYCKIRKVIDEREVVNYQPTAANGRTYNIVSVPFHNKDDSWVKLEIISDISEQKKVEYDNKILEAKLQQAHRMETIGTMAGGIAHDLNNILLPIMSYTQLALRDLERNRPVNEYLEQVLKSSNRARDLVRQILTFSRRGEREIKAVDIGGVVNEAIKLMRATLPSSIEIRSTINTEGSVVMADASQIHQMIMNLAANAGHAMSQGGTLEIELARFFVDEKFTRSHLNLSPGKYIKLSISDTGHGMDDKTLERIFDPFFTTKGVGEGTGLGLSLVHGVVLSHGGEIDVKSEPGKGTTFYIYLPCVASEAKEESVMAEEPKLPGRERILLVDDEEDVALVLKMSLERMGYTVTAITDSTEALEEFRKGGDRIDLVVTDYTMPKMNGPQLAMEMKKVRTDIPIILTSGLNQKWYAGDSRQGIFSDVVMKPFTGEDLGATIRRVMDGKV